MMKRSKDLMLAQIMTRQNGKRTPCGILVIIWVSASARRSKSPCPRVPTQLG
jgi:hypothetical protein